MIKIDIVKRIADQLKLKDKEALAVVDTIIESFKDTIQNHGRMEVRNFGVFQVKTRKPRIGRNPRNKQEYPIQPRKVVTFKLGKELKDFSISDSDRPKADPDHETKFARNGQPAPKAVQQASFLPLDGEAQD